MRIAGKTKSPKKKYGEEWSLVKYFFPVNSSGHNTKFDVDGRLRPSALKKTFHECLVQIEVKPGISGMYLINDTGFLMN